MRSGSVHLMLVSISLQVEIHHARSILEVFDSISYEKGSAVIRMLMDYLGYDIFQVGEFLL